MKDAHQGRRDFRPGQVPFQKATPIYDTEAGDIVAIVNNEKTIDGRQASEVLALALNDLAGRMGRHLL